MLLVPDKKEMEKTPSSRLCCGLANVSHAECLGHPELPPLCCPPLPPAPGLPLCPADVAQQCFCLGLNVGSRGTASSMEWEERAPVP